MNSTQAGRAMLLCLSAGLILSGSFALYLAATGQFLPHDERFLGINAAQLCSMHGCRIVHFMIHDRTSFGGALIALGLFYGWLTAFPLRAGHRWAWRLLLINGLMGFTSFFAYLGYGYFDGWHAVATLILLPCFVLGLAHTRSSLNPTSRSTFLAETQVYWSSATGIGRACLLFTSAGLAVAGLTILTVGMTQVFVPQDLDYLAMRADELWRLNPRLVPLIAHDRAGFGGVVCCCGIALLFTIWCAKPSPHLWNLLALAGTVGFVPAIFVHPAIGYTDPIHLAPAVIGASVYFLGLILSYRSMMNGGQTIPGPDVVLKEMAS